MTTWTRCITWTARALALAVVVFVALSHIESQRVSDTYCRAAWCQPGAIDAEAQRLVDAQVAVVTEGRDCWTPGARDEIPATVVVKGATVDKSVVWAISLDEAFVVNGDRNSWNDVIVIVACDAG